MFMLAEYVNMTTVSALATTLFLGGWQAPWPLSMWDGANTGWWPLLWFVAKVWVFLFLFMWLRATLPRLRYDQFMALGWKVLIPVSLVWIMTVAIVRTLRTQGYAGWAVLLITTGAFVAVALLAYLWRTLRRRRAVVDEAGPAADSGAFPIPPIPVEGAPMPRCLTSSTPSPASA